jgi:hypothetical protein
MRNAARPIFVRILYFGHLARNRACAVGTGNDVNARLRSLATTDVTGDFVERITDLQEVPTRFRQVRYENHCRLCCQIERRVSINRGIVGRHHEPVLGDFNSVNFRKSLMNVPPTSTLWG